MRSIRASFDAITDVFIDSLDGHCTSILCIASCWHLVVVPRGSHDYVWHLCRGGCGSTIAHDVFDDSCDLSNRLSFLVISTRRRCIGFRVVVSLPRRQEHAVRIVSTKCLVRNYTDVVC